MARILLIIVVVVVLALMGGSVDAKKGGNDAVLTDPVSENPVAPPTNGPETDPPAPVDTPTKSPTPAPTQGEVPTRSPTANPTDAPPTSSPPTGSPTPSPPTGSPVEVPTKSPTDKPSPTKRPTKSTTSKPTNSPTNPPAPTGKPTEAPTPLGTVPTGKPTTGKPTPSGKPTRSPTRKPTSPVTSSPTQGPVVPAPTNNAGLAEGGYCGTTWVPFPDFNGLIVSTVVFCCMGMAISAGAIGFLIHFWDRPVIRLSQPKFLVIFCIALITLNVGMLVMALGEVHPSLGSCSASIGIIEISMAFIVSALGLKEYRVFKVRVGTIRLERVKITDKVLYGYISLVVVILIAILIPLFVTEPPSPDPCENFRCHYGTFFFVSWGYLVLLILLTTAMAFVARDVPSIGGEASGILYTSCFICFVLIFLTMVFAISSLNNDIQIWLLSFGVLWITCCYVLLIVFRKYAWIHLTRDQVHAMFLGSRSHDSDDNSENNYYVPTKAASSSSSTSQEPHTATVPTNTISDIEPELKSDTEYGAGAAATPQEDEAPYQNPRPSVNLEQHEAIAFKIAAKDGWIEFVDRDTGESYWVEEATGRVKTTPPPVFDVALA